MNAPSWRILRIHDANGDTGDTLETLLESAPANFDAAELDGDLLIDWPAFTAGETLSLGGPLQWIDGAETADWTGFAAALAVARGGAEADDGD
jgi:hypothetical protein